MDKSQYKNVFVFCEQRDGKLQNVALELLGKAHDLAKDLDQQVYAMLENKKFYLEGNYKFATLDQIHCIVTEDTPDEDVQSQLQEIGVALFDKIPLK